MIKTLILNSYALILALIVGGCTGLLPSIEETMKSPWENFEEAKKAFDKIIPNQTTDEDLKRLGFDPFEIPNVKFITYLELLEKFMPNQSITMDDLDPEVRSCLKEREHCRGYDISPEMLYSERYGSVFLDLFNFRRKKLTKGWRFNALIILKDNLVVYKIWGGEPRVSEFQDKKNPLGPLQDINKVMPPIKLR